MSNDGKAMALAAGMVGLMLAGCSRSDEPAPPTDNDAKTQVSATKPSPSPSQVAATPTPAAVADAGVEIPTEAKRSQDEQMMDDASATGMTARSLRNEESAGDAAAEQNAID